MNSSSNRAQCQECSRSISVEATTCPECGYSPTDFLPLIAVFGGLAATATVIGAFLGIPALIAGIGLSLKRDAAKPTEESIFYHEWGSLT